MDSPYRGGFLGGIGSQDAFCLKDRSDFDRIAPCHAKQDWVSPVPSITSRLLTWYAQYYNRRHKRTSHLFENRYKSILCDEENYLLALVRYIHLNSIRAKIVQTMEQLDRYPWSGHRAFIGAGKSVDSPDRTHLSRENNHPENQRSPMSLNNLFP